jgi:ABC-type multidrug transport system fused ATPase/permease subunit
MARDAQPETGDEAVPPAKLTREGLSEAMRLARYIRPYRLRFFAAIFALLLANVLGLCFLAVTGTLVDTLLLTDRFGPTLDAIALILLSILIVQACCSFFELVWLNEVGERSLADLRRDVYSRLVRLPMVFHARRRVGELSSRVAADVSQIQAAIINVVPQICRQFIMLVGGIALIMYTSLHLALVMLSTFPVLIVLAVLFGRLIRRSSRDSQDRLADTNVVVEETLQGIATVKAFANERFEEDRYRRGLDSYLASVLRVAWQRAAFVAFLIFGMFGAVVLVMWYGARMVQSGQLTLGDLTRFMLCTLFVAGAMGSFADLYSQLQRAIGASQRVREILQEPVEPEDAPSAILNALTVNGQQPAYHRLRGQVDFEDLHFRYPTRKEVHVLRGVTLHATPGQVIALVGPSGSGKSTLVSMLLRFYEPDSGRLLIDGLDARNYPLHALRTQMAIVPQDVLLFGGTIAENIAYGRPGATEAEVIEAARKANADNFISALPERYATRVGERGVQLSGGQRQRVAIARAILRDPAILILDEATSSLDSESEKLVLQALEGLMEGRTSFVIAHRLSTVRRADRIYVLKEGTIVESGTHDELVNRENGVYRTLSELQLNLS